ncbi:DUF4307 domain-containing protein [Paramicrobacterium chengjingii]|uniref:DUF4307 domain-containing protein n=1 Tax=Paramicrobacterium chengjingii TaxID=2769067 RepID=A0ABX6YL64_9MICO|nr:DUF4307 domain-containing protein [Microbacterium chengjingii]QPZ39548.1 DUF4307 domain-containing protein [Microbacterium chengjingii]
MTDRQGSPDAVANTRADAASAPSQRLDARYGNSRASRIRLRVLLWSLGAFIVVVFGAWVLWAGLLAPAANVNAVDVAHTVVDEHTVDVTYQLTVAPGTAAMCAIQAQDNQHSIVGWKIVELPASDTRTRELTESVRTVDTAVTGLIYRCWLP